MVLLSRWYAPLLVAGLMACAVDVQSPESEQAKGNFVSDRIIKVVITMADADWQALREQSRSFITEFEGDCRAEPFQSP